MFAAKVAGLAGQLPEAMTKSLLPVMTILLMVSAEEEELLASVTVWAALVVLSCWLPNATMAGLSAIVPDPAEPASPPVPLSSTVNGITAPLVETVRVPVRLPEAVGVKVTAMTQEPLFGTDVPQVVAAGEIWKSPVMAGIARISG